MIVGEMPGLGSRRQKSRRMALFLALLTLLYIGAVIGFIIIY